MYERQGSGFGHMQPLCITQTDVSKAWVQQLTRGVAMLLAAFKGEEY
jgi:hypothetical protein